MEADVEQNGRKYRAIFSEDIPQGAYIILGPPEGLVDTLGYPEPFATNLHNVLFDRKIFTAKEASRKDVIKGALQEVLLAETQRLVEEFFKYEKETV